jgi:hypothetical protein
MKDPIVEEVRKARQDIFKSCGYDLNKYYQHLLAYQDRHKIKAVNLSGKRSIK